VVRGYRRADLATEIAGAQGVLEAAGIRCEVSVADLDLPPEVQSALAWVVREATTNVLRHGNARWCAVTAGANDEGVTLVVENDGAEGVTGTTGGSGLAGLRERLAAVEGTLTAGPAGADGGDDRGEASGGTPGALGAHGAAGTLGAHGAAGALGAHGAAGIPCAHGGTFRLVAEVPARALGRGPRPHGVLEAAS
jgi:two-component system sensor histidine kinase DesK